MSNRRVVITGLGCVTSLGQQVDQVFDALLAGTSGIKTITRWDTSRHEVKFGGQVDWQGCDRLDAREAKRLDRFVEFGVAAAFDAVDDAGLQFDQMDPFRTGVVVGSGIGGIEEFEQGHEKFMTKGPRRVSPMMIPKLMINAASANIAIQHGVKGPNYAVVTACASGGHAIADATQIIRRGDADCMIAGGTEAALTPLGVACFSTMKALSKRNDEPRRASRPFDKDRDGFVMAEGAGILILEDYDHAKARGARIYAEILGFGATCDAGHITAPDENGTGAQQAMRQALAAAGLKPEDIGHINSHATSTHLGDLAEVAAFKAVFGDHAPKVALNSTKSMTGHLLGASGGVEPLIVIKTLQTGKIPPTINLEDPEPLTDGLNLVANTAQEKDFKYALCNNFGFGGHNISIAFGKV